ncbi:alpha subunit of succinyl-CoA ligase [Violaceomyces palustris]|uniref:Alpha subunit of succinyl-CoA ligase n=1 Tax=Violaceomyces palustris TaxID=1673888 RepID=A0ACD0P1A6_9BASI|nr:alpha subunit of succinyl-CoA ligase [Violaceomyces palustris]
MLLSSSVRPSKATLRLGSLSVRGLATHASPPVQRSTIKALDVGPETRVIVQGLGKASTFHSTLSLQLGTNIVGGVSPGKGGQSYLDRPVFNSVREAAEALKPQATSVFVPPKLAADAIIEAIEAEIPLIVSVAEGIPLKDQMRVMAALHSQSASRLVGANSPGLCNPAGCRMGISPLAVANPGPVGIASRSGTLSYEASAATKEMGQSMVLGLGGDFYPGTRTAEALEFFMEHEPTKVIVLVGEVGGVMEEEAAELAISKYRRPDGSYPKPIIGFISGQTVPPGQTFGHSGAIWRDSLSSGKLKKEAFEKAGFHVVTAIADVGEKAKSLLAGL